MLNRVDPRSGIDEDRSGYEGTGTIGLAGGETRAYAQDSAGYSLGSENTTSAEPHKSNFMQDSAGYSLGSENATSAAPHKSNLMSV